MRFVARHTSVLIGSAAFLFALGGMEVPVYSQSIPQYEVDPSWPKLPLGNGWITGGLGGLGLCAARLLVRHGTTVLVLASRSGTIPRDGQGLQQDLQQVVHEAPIARVCAADAGSTDDVIGLLRVSMHPSAPLRRVLHAAGLGDKGLIESATLFKHFLCCINNSIF